MFYQSREGKRKSMMAKVNSSPQTGGLFVYLKRLTALDTHLPGAFAIILLLCLSFAGCVKSPEYNYKIEAPDFHWTIDGRDVLRITSDGNFYVEGRWTANDAEIYQAYKKWLDYTMEIIK